MDLPTSGNNSDPNKAFIRMITVNGSGAYTVSSSLGGNLTWNGTYWQLTRLVSGVNGSKFYISTQPSCEGVLVNGLAASNISATNVTLTWTAVFTKSINWILSVPIQTNCFWNVDRRRNIGVFGNF
jgi:hypothetical protein